MNLELEKFVTERRFTGKGALAVALVVTDHARTALANDGFPMDASRYLTDQGGQVQGLGKSSVQSILNRHGIDRVLAEEGGRTSRGSIGNMTAYVGLLNQLHESGNLEIDLIEKFWVSKVNAFFAGKPFSLRLDASWGIRASIRNLMSQVIERQRTATGTMYVGTVMQHLVGAKLDVVLGAGVLIHHSANQSDQGPNRHGDFDIEDVAIHVSAAPSEALVRKCQSNIEKAKRPIIISTHKGVVLAEGLLENALLANRVDLIEFEQFIATNVLELGRFSRDTQHATLDQILRAYNNIVDMHETDPSLKIQISSGK